MSVKMICRLFPRIYLGHTRPISSAVSLPEIPGMSQLPILIEMHSLVTQLETYSSNAECC